MVDLDGGAGTEDKAGEALHLCTERGDVGLSREVAGEGVLVNAVAPGMIDTDIHATAGVPDRAHRLGSMVPIGRAGTAEEVAEAVVWLLSDAARYCIGTILNVNGGR